MGPPGRQFIICWGIIVAGNNGLFPLLRTIGCSTRSPSCTSYDDPNLGVPLTTRQPMEFLWISSDPIPHCCVPFIEIHIFKKIGQSLLCSGSSTQHTTCITIIYKSLLQHSYTELILKLACSNIVYQAPP